MRERILEVQVDFFFLGLVESKFKMILLRQVFSGLLGVTAVSENVQVTGQHLRQILAEFGLLETLEGPPVDFRTDAQDEVGTVLRRSGLPREYTVNKAGPQNHDTVGSVERGVREVKGSSCCLALGTGQGRIGFGRQLGCLGGRFQVCDCYAQPPRQDPEHRKDWKGIAQEHI